MAAQSPRRVRCRILAQKLPRPTTDVEHCAVECAAQEIRNRLAEDRFVFQRHARRRDGAALIPRNAALPWAAEKRGNVSPASVLGVGVRFSNNERVCEALEKRYSSTPPSPRRHKYSPVVTFFGGRRRRRPRKACKSRQIKRLVTSFERPHINTITGFRQRRGHYERLR